MGIFPCWNSASLPGISRLGHSNLCLRRNSNDSIVLTVGWICLDRLQGEGVIANSPTAAVIGAKPRALPHFFLGRFVGADSYIMFRRHPPFPR
jgi:hypothetical protein